MQVKVYAKAVILDENDNVLLLRRSPTDEGRPGGQDFPGGNIEPGETLDHGMAREIAEEVGITVDPNDLQLFYAATEAYGDRSVTRLVFWARVTSPEVTLSFEHDQYRWINASQASQEFPHPVYGVALDYGLHHRLFDPPLPTQAA